MKTSGKKKIVAISAVMVFMVVGATGCSGVAQTEEAKTPAETLYEKLTMVYSDGKTLFGHQDDPVYGHAWKYEKDRSDILETAGDYPAIMGWDLGGIELGNDCNLDSVPFALMAEEVSKHHKRGGINTFSWHLFNPVDSTDSWTIGDSLTVVKIVNDSAVNAAFRKQARRVAEFLGSLVAESGERIPVIFRPFHEMTGNWFWWGKPYATPEQYRQLWKIVREEFDRKELDNVLYAYSPDRFAITEQYMEYYPGDDNVDILGVDIYHFNGEEGLDEYISTAGNALEIVKRISVEKGKIPAFTETGAESVPMAQWWTEVLLPLLKQHRVAYVEVWRNAHNMPNHYYAPFPGQPSEASFREFCKDSTIMLVKDLR